MTITATRKACRYCSGGVWVAQAPDLMGTADARSQMMEAVCQGSVDLDGLVDIDGQWCVAARPKTPLSPSSPMCNSGTLYYSKRCRYVSGLPCGQRRLQLRRLLDNWVGAWGRMLNGDVLTSLYANAQLSYWSSDNQYVYANGGSGYTPLTVKFHSFAWLRGSIVDGRIQPCHVRRRGCRFRRDRQPASEATYPPRGRSCLSAQSSPGVITATPRASPAFRLANGRTARCGRMKRRATPAR